MSSQGQPTIPTCTSWNISCISWKYFCREYPAIFFTLEVSPHLYGSLNAPQVSCFQTSVSLRLPHSSCWPLSVQVISGCSVSFFPPLFDFFMKVLSFIPSNSSGIDNCMKFGGDRSSRECAERIAGINSIFVVISHILENKSHSALDSSQVALSDSFCCYLCLIPVPAAALVSFRL